MEIAQLKIGDVFNGKELRGMSQLQTKGGGTRRISLVDKKLRSALTTFYEVSNLSSKPMTAPLFTNPSGGSFTANGIVKQFVKMYKKADLPCSSHSGRMCTKQNYRHHNKADDGTWWLGVSRCRTTYVETNTKN